MPKRATQQVIWDQELQHYQVMDDALEIVPDSQEWFVWLDTISSFAFSGKEGSCTVRKEARTRGETYWYAYHRTGQQVSKQYLGKSVEVTIVRLEQAAMLLAQGHDEERQGSRELAQQGSKSATPMQLFKHKQTSHSPTSIQEGLRLLKSEPMWKIPATFTSFIGREREVSDICVLLQSPDVRLLTLLGTGGIGKTRLSAQVAAQMRPFFADGICFVSLAAITEPQLVVSTLAETLGVQQVGEAPLFEQIRFFLRNKHLLLILDNFEQVVSAAPLVEELLAACAALKIVVTRRAVLHLQVERIVPVSPLALPPSRQQAEQEALAENESVALFVQRAQAVQPRFGLTATNAQAIAEICTRLDGLPLAIELAAARIALLSPQMLLARLSQRLDLLIGGARTLPTRQQTLRNTLQWSYDLLTEEERRLFRRLSVFVGGWTLEAALYEGEKSTSANILDLMSSLLEKSLIQRVEQDEDEACFLMLEMLREYGLEQLHDRGEEEAVRQAHAQYYLRWVAEIQQYSSGPKYLMWLRQMGREQENLFIALEWFLKRQDPQDALRLGSVLADYWYRHAYLKEGWHQLEMALQLPQAERHSIKAAHLFGAAEAQYGVKQEMGLTERDELTARQIEILRLVAQGLSDAQIAEQLIISPRTVNTHLTTIYQKIGVTSRAAATRYAFEHSLL